VDFRLISATNENLEDMVREGRFREDLYYRIHVVPIFVPALRERVDDIPVLAEYFVSIYCAANGFPLKRLADDAMLALKRYPWPGNVRELENAIQRLVIMTDEETITMKDLPPEIMQAAGRDSRAAIACRPRGSIWTRKSKRLSGAGAGGAGAGQASEVGRGAAAERGPEPAELPLPQVQSIVAR